MRRSILIMSIAWGGLSTPLVAQAAWTVGLAATIGGGWQIEGGDIGYVRGVGAGPIRHLSVVGRFGSFIDEGAIFGGARGFVAALALAARTGTARVFELGSDLESTTSVGLDVTFEATGYLGSHSPLPQGSPWGAVAVLPGFRVGRAGEVQYSLLLGPTVFVGEETDVRTFLGIRVEVPLARPERQP